jgi:hypothetical protein
MAFFRNSAVNLLNLHYGLHRITLYGGGAFFLVYLLKAGLSVPAVLVSLALILVGRFAVRPLVIALAARWGLRAMLITGTLLSALQYPVVAEVHGIGIVLLALIAVAAVGDMLYWTTYHANFAALGDNEFRGHQIGAREAIAAVVGIISPVVAGWILVAFGPRAAFGATSIITALAALPLLGTPKVCVARRVPGGFKAALPGTLVFMADGWLAVGFWFAWQLALFSSLGGSFLAYGGALAVSALVGAIGGVDFGAAYRCRARESRGLVGRSRHGDNRLAARGRDWPSSARGAGERAGSARRMRLHPHRDDGSLHDGEAVALHIALPCGDRGRMGCWWCRRPVDRCDRNRIRPPAGRKYSTVACRLGSNRNPAAPLLCRE